MSSRRKVASITTTAILLAGGCAKSAEIDPPQPPTAVASENDQAQRALGEIVLDTVITDKDGGTWPIICRGLLQPVTAKNGDTLIGLVEQHTQVVRPALIGRYDTPLDIVAAAVAKINGIEDPNTIFAGQEYFMPEQCEPGPD